MSSQWLRLNAYGVLIGALGIVSGITISLRPETRPLVVDLGRVPPGLYVWAALFVLGGLLVIGGIMFARPFPEAVGLVLIVAGQVWRTYVYGYLLGWTDLDTEEQYPILLVVVVCAVARISAAMPKKDLVAVIPGRETVLPGGDRSDERSA